MSESIRVDLTPEWSLVPLIDGIPEPKWATWQPPQGIEGLAAVSQLVQRLSGEIALLRTEPIFFPGTQTRDTASEEQAFFDEVTPGSLHFNAFALLVSLATKMLHPVHYAIARSALEKDAPTYQDHDVVVEMLACAFQEAAISLMAYFRNLAIFDFSKPEIVTSRFESDFFNSILPFSEEEQADHADAWNALQRQRLTDVWPTKDGMFIFDAAFAEWVDSYLNENGKDYADEIREGARLRWQQYSQRTNYQFPELKLYGDASLFVLWLDISRGPYSTGPDRGPVPARWPRGLCRTIWRGLVKAKADRLPKHAPSITSYAQNHISRIRKPAGIRESTRGLDVLDSSGDTIGYFQTRRDVIGVDGEAVQKLLRSGIEQLPRLMVERLIRGWLLDVDAQARKGVNPFNRLHYEGGYSELAERYDINSKDRHMLPDVLEALAQYRSEDRWLPPIISQPYFLGQTRGRRAKLWIDIGAALAPGYINHLPATIRGPARTLYPLPFRQDKLLPDLSFANNRYWPALCDLQWRLIAELRARPEEASTVGVFFEDELIEHLSSVTGLPVSLVQRALEEWSLGEDAWLQKSPQGRITFESSAATAMLRDALKIEENARRGGLSNSAKKRRVGPSSSG